MEHSNLAIGIDGSKKRIAKKETKRRKPSTATKPRPKAAPSSSKRTGTQKKRTRASGATGKKAGHNRHHTNTTNASSEHGGGIGKGDKAKNGGGDHDSDSEDDPLADREFMDALVSHVPGQLYRDPAYMTRVKHADPHGWWDRNMVCVTPSDWLTSEVAPLMSEVLQGQECFADLRIIAKGLTGVNMEAQSAALERAATILDSIVEGLVIDGSWREPLSEALGNVRRAAESLHMFGMLAAAMEDRTSEALANERAFRLAVAAKLRDVMRSGRATLVHHDTLPTSIFHMRATSDGPHGPRGRGK